MKKRWPLGLEILRSLAKPEDVGLGDIIERLIGPIGGDAYKKWFEKAFGTPCGCTEHKNDLNERFPL